MHFKDQLLRMRSTTSFIHEDTNPHHLNTLSGRYHTLIWERLAWLVQTLLRLNTKPPVNAPIQSRNRSTKGLKPIESIIKVPLII